MSRSTGFVWTDSIASSKLGENVEVVEYILDQAEMLEEMRDPNENDDIGAPGAGTEIQDNDDDVELGAVT